MKNARAACFGVVLLTLGTVACGGSGGGPMDAGPGDAGPGDAGPRDGGPGDASDVGPIDSGGIDSGPPTLATMPALPMMGACPTGWHEVARGGVSVCDPWPETGIADCSGPAEAHFPGTPGCAAVGAECPGGDFAEGLPAGAIHALPGGAPGSGDGSAASPYPTIAAALAVATSGDVVALGKGTFIQNQIDLPAGVTLWGACPGATVLSSEDQQPWLGTVHVTTAGGSLRDLRIEGDRPGILVVAGGEVTVEGVVVFDAETRGVVVMDGGQLSGRRLSVLDTRPLDGFGAAEGLAVFDGGQVDLEELVISGSAEQAVAVDGAGSRAELQDVALRDTVPTTAGSRGAGVWATGGELVLTRAAIDRNTEAGVGSLGVGTRVTGTMLVIRDVAQSVGATDHGSGLLARDSGFLEVTGAWVERATHVGVLTGGGATRLVLRDALVRDTQLGARPERDLYGMGIFAQGTNLELERVAAVDNKSIGVVIQLGGTSMLRDLTVRGTQSTPMRGLFGRGLEITRGSVVTVERAFFEGNRDSTVTVHGAGTDVTLTDVTIRDTRSRASDGRFGYGLEVLDSGLLSATRLDIAGTRGVGLSASGAGTSLNVSNARVFDTRPLDCASSSCAGATFAYGAGAYDGASVTLADFVLEGSADAAVQLATGGEADLTRGEIISAPLGFNVQTVGFDEARLRVDVSFVDVATESSAEALDLTEGVTVPPIGI